jgi:uroporphyrinogen decarboxylase
MMDFAVAVSENIELINTMMDIFIEWNLVVLEKLQRLGLDFIATYNDLAYKEGPLVSPQMFREVFLPKMKIVADAIKLPWAFHSDGNLTIVMEDLLSLGMNCVNPFEPPVMDLKVAKEKWGDRICLWGNIDLVQTLPYGTVEDVEAEVKQRIQEAAPGGGYICATANSITDWCKIENIFAMTAAVKKYGTYPLQI